MEKEKAVDHERPLKRDSERQGGRIQTFFTADGQLGNIIFPPSALPFPRDSTVDGRSDDGTKASSINVSE